jgi:hypothetical protein
VVMCQNRPTARESPTLIPFMMVAGLETAYDWMNRPMSTAGKPTRIPKPEDYPSGWQWFGRIVIYWVTSRNQRRGLKRHRKNIPALENTIATLKEQLAKSQKHGLEDAIRIHNVGLYLLLMNRDVAIIRLDIVSTFEEWRMKFYARQLALLLYEVCDDLPVMLGKDFRASLTNLDNGRDPMAELDPITKRINQFKKINEPTLYHIRNMIAGHRDKDAILFMEEVDQLDPLAMMRLTAELFDIIHDLIAFLIQVTTRMGTPQSAFRQLTASPTFMKSLESK